MRAPRVGVVVSALSLLTALAATPALAGGEPFGNSYVSTSIEKEGERYELFDDKRLRVSFSGSDGQGSVGWRATCNEFFAPVQMEGNRLIIESAGSTLMECFPLRRMRQDNFIKRFFEADPTYVVSGNRLELSARDVVIHLRQRD